jgi:hypothetical protein
MPDEQPADVYIQPRNPVVNQNTDISGTTRTQGFNPYTGQMWSNTTQSNGYTYGTTTNGQMYQGNVNQPPTTQLLNDFAIKGFQNMGAQMGGAFYNATEGQ